ncbi:MAG: CBS domain-containing protein [Solirubrobacterales bacterium]|nr:CBS domain-containing protein [Solirubrobacterales bacterium]
MPDSIARSVIREVEPLSVDELIAEAVRKVLDSGLPGLPAVDADGAFVGIFGEREFMKALFPGYMDELGSGAMIRRSIDDAIERREACRSESIRDHLTTDHVVVEDDYSDSQLAEIFLHHRVLVVPIATAGRVHAVVTRADFFAALFEKFEAAGG